MVITITALKGGPQVALDDLAKFGADVVMDIMRTHPMVVVGGVLQDNPFFVPPDEFLRELHERAQRQEGRGTTFTVRLPLALELAGSGEPGA